MATATRTARTTTALLLPGVLAIACGTAGDAGPAINDGPLYRAFENASIDEGVPLDLLLAVGWVESRWVAETPDAPANDQELAPDGQPTGDHVRPAYGVMKLRAGDTLDLAAQLTGLDAETIKTDADANVRGAAAVLRRFADEANEGADVDAMPLSAWRDVVARWTGIDDPDLAMSHAEEVFTALEAGAGRTLPDGEVIELAAHPDLQVEADVSDGAAGPADPEGKWASDPQGLGMAGVPFDPAYHGNYTDGRGGNRVRYVVIHTTQGSYAGTVSWIKNPSSRVSVHYVVRSRDGQRVQMVDENDTAWHAGNWSYNQQSVGIEHEGFVSDPEWYTDAMYRSSARLTCDIVKRHNIPVDRSHIIGHVEVPQANHTDPGRYWNWDYYMQLVRECTGGTQQAAADDGNQGPGGTTTTPPRAGQGTLQGVVYANGNPADRIAGAHVRLSNGLQATTASNGFFSFTVTAATYTITATADGYRSGSVARTVAANAQVWGSVNLVRGTEPTGRVTGIVFVAGDANRRIAGASVTVAGKRATTDATGHWTLDVAPGASEVDITATGYRATQLFANVTAGRTITLNAGLVARDQAGDLAGTVVELGNASRKIAGATIVAVHGTTRLTATTDGAGNFTIPGAAAGTWRVTASASGYASGSKSATVVAAQRNAVTIALSKVGAAGTGTLIGVVYEAPNTTKRIPNATVSLSNGVTVTADGNGVYQVAAIGRVTAIASAPGYSSRSVTRTVAAGARIWGSIGLVKGAADAGTSGTSTSCNPTAPRGSHRLDAVVVLKSPIDEAVVSRRPTFSFEGIGDASASYRIVLAREGDAERTIDVPAGDAPSVPASFDLPAGHWAWGVYPRWADCQHGEVLYWGFFTVQ